MYTYDWMYEMLSEWWLNESYDCEREWCKYEWCKNVIIELLESMCVCGECVYEFLYVCLYERERLNAENAKLKIYKNFAKQKKKWIRRTPCTENECDWQAGKDWNERYFHLIDQIHHFIFHNLRRSFVHFPGESLSFYVFILFSCHILSKPFL